MRMGVILPELRDNIVRNRCLQCLKELFLFFTAWGTRAEIFWMKACCTPRQSVASVRLVTIKLCVSKISEQLYTWFALYHAYSFCDGWFYPCPFYIIHVLLPQCKLSKPGKYGQIGHPNPQGSDNITSDITTSFHWRSYYRSSRQKGHKSTTT